MSEKSKIKEDLQQVEDNQLTAATAYQKLFPVMKQADEDREHLKQLHIDEKGIAVATDAHILVAVQTDCNSRSEEYPFREMHKTDKVRSNGEGLEVICTHSNDLSGKISSIKSEENPHDFPQVNKVWPETSDDLKVKLNPDLLKQVLEAVDSGGDEGVVLSFVETDEGIDAAAPAKVKGDQGVGIIMPIRIEQ